MSEWSGRVERVETDLEAENKKINEAGDDFNKRKPRVTMQAKVAVGFAMLAATALSIAFTVTLAQD